MKDDNKIIYFLLAMIFAALLIFITLYVSVNKNSNKNPLQEVIKMEVEQLK